eukprot:3824048-Pyramimonas_sp.AAC.1
MAAIPEALVCRVDHQASPLLPPPSRSRYHCYFPFIALTRVPRVVRPALHRVRHRRFKATRFSP